MAKMKDIFISLNQFSDKTSLETFLNKEKEDCDFLNVHFDEIALFSRTTDSKSCKI